ncbi:hypothetical protein GVAMD_1284 [Gardnerella vaginalis AMD]|nr:hypothetical protein GVAMD_1284 [Gardnerella vaginalis AMD]
MRLRKGDEYKLSTNFENTSTYKTYSIVTVLNRKYAIKANKIYKI